jgi:hypothetical protein
LERFNTNARVRQKAHSYFDYQLTDKLSLGLGGDFRYDSYPDSIYGLQSSRNWSVNLDGSYAFDENTSIQVFYSYQDINSKSAGMSYAANSNTGSTTAGSVIGGCYDNVRAVNNNARVDSCRNWFTNMSDFVNTVGLGFKHKGFLNGKMDVKGDFLWSFARTLIGVEGGQYARTTTASATNGPFYYTQAADMPVVKTETFQFKLDAKYIINKPSAVHFSYLFQRSLNRDYFYTGTQAAGTPTSVMPTFEQAPNYAVHVFGLSYIYNF